MDKIKRLFNFVLPVTTCNFQCHYCYVRQDGCATGEMGDLSYSPEQIQRAMTVERLGGICHINMCGLGETLLADYAVELAGRMLENGHYVSVVTNGTIRKRIQELCEFPEEWRGRMFFKFSFHYIELLRHGNLDAFFETIAYVKACGCAFSVELTVNDETVLLISEIQELCMERLGAYCHVVESRNNQDGMSRLTVLPVEKHQTAWSKFESPLFAFQQEHWMKKREEFCYAGDWILSLDVASGWIYPCFGGGNAIQNIFENPEEKIRFTAIGHNCCWTHCYAAYVLLTSGAIPEVQGPPYAMFRDRICTDGSTWLTTTVRSFFESKLSDTNSMYSPEKALYIDALMALEYNSPREFELIKLSAAVEKKLSKKGIHSVAVWGTGKGAKWILSVLSKSSISVKYLIDTEFSYCDALSIQEKAKRICKYPIKRILSPTGKAVLVNRYDRVPRVDAVIVLNHAHFEQERIRIGDRSDRVLSLTELADD